MPGYIVDMEAVGALARLMTKCKNFREALDETFSVYKKDEIKRIKILPEKVKK